MASSLSDQLSTLRNKQSTAQNVGAESSFSLLFSFREASRFSREDILEVASLGLQELSADFPEFDPFFDSLFSPLSKYYNRETKTTEDIDKTDAEVLRFLYMSADKFNHRGLHKCLEYLLKVYQVNKYNEEALILAFLPFHSDPVYVKLIQNINLKKFEIFKFMHRFSFAGKPIQLDHLAKEISSSPLFLTKILDFLTKGAEFGGMSAHIDLLVQICARISFSETNLVNVIISFFSEMIKNSCFYGLSELFVIVATRFNLTQQAVYAILSDLLVNLEENEHKQCIIKALLVACSQYVFT